LSTSTMRSMYNEEATDKRELEKENIRTTTTATDNLLQYLLLSSAP
jgi:hypothetical protein